MLAQVMSATTGFLQRSTHRGFAYLHGSLIQMNLSIRSFCITALLASTMPAAAQELVIESSSGGKNNDKYREVAGNWIDSRIPAESAKSSAPGLTPPGEIGSRKHVFGTEAKIEAAARFFPEFAEKGHYYVYVTWPRGANAQPVEITIKHAGGEEKKSVIQDGWGVTGGNANQWIALGEFDFESGSDQFVELKVSPGATPVDERNTGQIYTDAVAFSTKPLEALKATTPLGPTAPTAPTPTSAPVRDTGPIKWLRDIGEAQKKAKAEDKKILLFFYSPQSANSQYLENEAFEHPAVKAAVHDEYVPLKINFVENTDLAYKLAVFKAGTINLYDSSGKGLDQISDRLSPEELARGLKEY